MKVCIVLPLHLYKYDIQGNLNYNEKIQMYLFSLMQSKTYSMNYKIFVICHGIKTNKFNKIKGNIQFIWSNYFQEPNIHGLFDNNPAQRNIVYEGLLEAKKQGYTHVIKGRADSTIRNIKLLLDTLKKNPDKFIFTQITTFTRPWLLGDCFMAGEINKLIKLWGPSEKYHQDGLVYFANKLLQLENSNDLYLLLINKSIYYDLNSLKICDFRFTWKNKNKWLKDNKYNYEDILWGKNNNWIIFNKKYHYGDRPNILSEKIVKNSFMYRFKIIRELNVCLKKAYKLIFSRELYNL